MLSDKISRLLFLGLALIFVATGSGWAQPPALIQFQGRLTNSSNVPLTGNQLVFFSLWQGGTDATANSGTQFYSEQAVITADVNGVFEHQVGSGTSPVGTIDPSKFNTASPVFLQIAVTSTSNVLLPRTRLTSVGYAMMAGVAAFAAQAGGVTTITSVTDQTGGLLVIGDLVRIQGTNMGTASVQVGGVEAPVKSQTASEIIFQIPAGAPEGLDTVILTQGNGNNAPLAFTTVDVHRLIIAIAPLSHAIFVLDSRNGTVVTTINASISFDPTRVPIQIGFGSQGALALIPGNVNGTILALDMTANPPAIVASFNPGLTSSMAVSVSPDNTVAMVSDRAANRVMAIPLLQKTPPFTSNLFSNSNYSLLIPAGQTAPHGSTFIGDQLFLVCFESGNVVGYRRDPFQVTLRNEFIDAALNPEDLPTVVAAGTGPYWIKPLPDLTRVLLLTRDQTNLQVWFVGPKGLTSLVSPGAEPAGGTVLNVSFSRDDSLLLSANQGSLTDQAQARNRINIFNVVGGAVQLISGLEGFNHNPNFDQLLQTLVMDPVDGRNVAISTTYGSIEFTRRTGGTLSYFTNPVSGASKVFDKEVDLPNIGRESIPILEIQP